MTPGTLRDELEMLSICYPSPKKSAQELAVLAEMWAEDLADLSDDELRAAIAAQRKHSKWFPTAAGIRDRHNGLKSSLYPERKQLPEHTGPRFKPSKEDFAKLRAKVRKIGQVSNLKHRRRSVVAGG